MMFKTHLAFAVLMGIFIIFFLRPDAPYIFGSLFLFSAILPDIDCSRSFLGRRLRPLSSLINFLFGHRGFLHTLWMPLILYSVLHLFSFTWAALAVAGGYMLHIMLDTFSAEGIRLFSPLWKKRFHGFVKTGGLAEHFALLVVCLGIGYFIIRLWGLPLA